MTQNVLDYSQNPSGNELMDTYLAGMAENQLTNHSGVSRPTYAKAGTFWIDTSATPWILKQFNGTNDVVLGTLNQSGLYFTAQRALNDKNGNDITTTYLGANATAVKATGDKNGNDITTTYLPVNGTAVKAIADANGDNIANTYGKIASENTWTGNNTLVNKEIFLKRTDYEFGVPPSSDIHFAIGTIDKNNTWFGGFEQHINSNGRVLKRISQKKPDGTDNYAFLDIGYDTNGKELAWGSAGVVACFDFWGMPNYAGRVGIYSGYTAPSNGFAFLGLWPSYDEQDVKIYVNGYDISTIHFRHRGMCPTTIPLKAGDVISWDTNLDSRSFYNYYPCIGG